MEPIQSGDDRRTDLAPKPINPAHVLAGTPEASCVVLSRSDDGITTGLWECTAGRFNWYYGSDEIVHIVEGEVHVTDETGRVVTLGPGDVAHFAPGARTEWHVPHLVKKFFVDVTPAGDPLSRGVRALRRTAKRALRAHHSPDRSTAPKVSSSTLRSSQSDQFSM